MATRHQDIEAVTLRDLNWSDIPVILRIEDASFSTPWRESTFRNLLGRSDSDLIGAIREGGLVGYAIAWTVGDQAELGNVAVSPEARRGGLGTRLVAAMLERIAERGAREVFLEVRVSNEGARRLYAGFGFDVIGRRKNYYTRPVEDALVMRLRLS